MGNFFQAAHVRHRDSAAALAAIEHAARELDFRCWIAPRDGDWLSFFPSHDAPSSAICRAISRQLGGEVLLTVVHDSDVFCYALFRDGREADDFASNPDYFPGASEAERQRARGNPVEIAPLLLPTRTRADLEQWYANRAALEPEVLMAQFHALLGLPSALSSYEYLERGERDGVIRWREFVHVPDRAAEQAAAREEAGQVRLTKQRLVRAGALVFDSTLGRGRNAWENLRVHGPHPAGGFVVSWHGGEPSLQHWLPPAPPVPLPFGAIKVQRYQPRQIAHSRPFVLTVDSAVVINFAAAAAEPCPGPARTWLVAIDDRTQTAVFMGREELIGVSFPGGAERFRISLGYPTRSFRLHPRQPHLAWFGQRELGVIDLAQGAVIGRRQLFNRLLVPKKTAQWRAAGTPLDFVTELDREDFLSLEFSADGEWLVAGTTEGLRLYRYAAVLDAGARMPDPEFAVETSVQLQDNRGVNDLVVDADRERVIFTTGDDSLRTLDLRTREVSAFTPPIDRARVFTLVRSGHLLAAHRRGYLDLKRREDDFSHQVWNLDALPQT